MIPLLAALLIQATDLDRALVEDLGRLKASVLADLREPDAPRLPNGLHDLWRVRRSLDWACGWTHPDFIPPLKALLEKPGEWRFRAALCLLRYGREDLDAAVLKFGEYEYTRMDGCLLSFFKVSSVAEDLRKNGRMPAFIEASDLDRLWPSLRKGKPEEREAAWIRLGTLGRFLPWKDFGLDANALWAGAEKHGVASPFHEPRVGGNRLMAFLAEVRDTAPRPYDRQRATARRWALGGDEDGPSCVKLVRGTAEAFGKPGFAGHAYLEDLAWRPLADARVAYQELTRTGSHELQRLGWTALVRLNDPASEDLESLWNHAGQDLAKEAQLRAVASLALSRTAHRRQWIEWLLRLQPKVPMNADVYPAWIDAVSGMAGRHFGTNGVMVPLGFEETLARETTQAILQWAATQPK